MTLNEDSKPSHFLLDIHRLTWYNTHMKNNPFNIAMELSNGTFAHYLCGVLRVLHDGDGLAPDPDAEATHYLDTFYEGWNTEDEDLRDYEPSDDGWMDEDALASAGFGMDESYE